MLALRGVEVRFGDVPAVTGADLDLGAGELLALLGPSGCGKSTLLRAIAGLEPLAAGTISLDGDDITAVSPEVRPFGLMFQDHALFPHRNVGQNVEFGLRMNDVDPGARRERVVELLELVGLAGYERRAVTTLSGGEAQRVALARALAPAPRVLLLDEPLGSLDRHLRDRLIGELPAVLDATGTAAIHVTHDHDEAFALGDRVGVMHDGRLHQVDPPSEVWAAPRSLVVARILGHTNVIEGPAGSRFGAPTPQSSTRPGMSRRRLTGCTFAASTTMFVCGQQMAPICGSCSRRPRRSGRACGCESTRSE